PKIFRHPFQQFSLRQIPKRLVVHELDVSEKLPAKPIIHWPTNQLAHRLPGIVIVEVRPDHRRVHRLRQHLHSALVTSSPRPLVPLVPYFSIPPQAIRSPEFPDGSDIKSSAFAWITSDVPPS